MNYCRTVPQRDEAVLYLRIPDHIPIIFREIFTIITIITITTIPCILQEESDFISEMLQYLPNIGCLYTAGVGVTVFNVPVWVWQTNSQTIQFNRWWPGKVWVWQTNSQTIQFNRWWPGKVWVWQTNSQTIQFNRWWPGKVWVWQTNSQTIQFNRWWLGKV